MSTKSVESSGGQNLAQWLLNKKTWTTHFLIVAAISVAGLVYLGQQTYSGAPPLVDYVSADTGEVFLVGAPVSAFAPGHRNEPQHAVAADQAHTEQR